MATAAKISEHSGSSDEDFLTDDNATSSDATMLALDELVSYEGVSDPHYARLQEPLPDHRPTLQKLIPFITANKNVTLDLSDKMTLQKRSVDALSEEIVDLRRDAVTSRNEASETSKNLNSFLLAMTDHLTTLQGEATENQRRCEQRFLDLERQLEKGNAEMVELHKMIDKKIGDPDECVLITGRETSHAVAKGIRAAAALQEDSMKQPARNPGTSSHQKVKLPDYDGTYEAGLYLRQVDKVSTLNGWSEDVLLAHMMAALKGSAREILACFPEEDELTLDRLKCSLKDRFGRIVQKDVARSLLQDRMQREDETPRQLAVDVERLINHAYPEAKGEIREELVVEAFLRALGDQDLKLQCRLKGPKRLRDAVKDAETVESCLRQARPKNSAGKQTRHVNAVEASTESSIAKQLERATTGIAKLQIQMEELQKKSLRPQQTQQTLGRPGDSSTYHPVECYHCGKFGHIQRNCGVLNRANHTRPMQGSQRPGNRFNQDSRLSYTRTAASTAEKDREEGHQDQGNE